MTTPHLTTPLAAPLTAPPAGVAITASGRLAVLLAGSTIALLATAVWTPPVPS